MGSARVLSVGWDGADLATIEAMIARGQLLHLARLREEGRRGPLTNLPGLADDPHWSSFATSLPPERHGRFHHEHAVEGAYYQVNFPREAMTVPPFWEAVAAAGRRVAVLDVPKSPLGAHPNLRVLADWMPHGEDGPIPVGSPATLPEELTARYGPAPALDCHRVIRPGDEPGIADSIARRLELRTRVALDWLGEADWDLFQVVFAESHCIGHHCWHVHDPSHPEHNPEGRQHLGDVLEDTYARQDAVLGQLIAAAGPDATVIVSSPLGMGPNYDGSAIVQTVLDRLTGRVPGGRAAPLLRRLPDRIVRGLPPLRRRAEALAAPPYPGPLPYWQLQHDAISSAIRLNVAGRDSEGTIQPGADFDHHIDRLTEAFRSLRRVAGGTPVVSEVVDVAAAYPGPAHDRFADLLIVWDTSAPIAEVTSPTLGRIVAPPKPVRTGNHRTPGWATIAGPGLAPGTLPEASLMDLGPTIAALLGAPLEAVAGHPLLEPSLSPAPSVEV